MAGLLQVIFAMEEALYSVNTGFQALRDR